MNYYNHNENDTNFLKDFSKSYQSNEALRWYIPRFCLHRLLSRAFIDHDMTALVDMYLFIFDINRNIQQKNTSHRSSIRLFRCQLISGEKFDFFKNHINQLIITQCFLLAYTSRGETSQMIRIADKLSLRLMHMKIIHL